MNLLATSFTGVRSSENTTQSLMLAHIQQPRPATNTKSPTSNVGVVVVVTQASPTQSSYANQQSMQELVEVVVPTSGLGPTSQLTMNKASLASSEDSTLIVGDLSCLRDKFRPAPFVLNADIKYMR